MNLRRILSQAALITGALLFSAGIQTFAFTQPSTSPPNSDAYAPLSTSPTAQSKQGGLLLNTGGATNGLIVQSGNVGIGTASPSQQLDVAGYVKGSGLCIGGDCRTSWSASVSGSQLTGPVPVGNSNFGGLYTIANDNNGATGNYCGHVNPYTGGCSCPGGFNSYQLTQIVGAYDFNYPLHYRQQVYQCLR